jgi:hypothetical protein
MNSNQNDVTTTNRCQASTKAGQPCQGYAGVGSTYCFIHDPEKRAKRKEARSAGGKARHRRRITWADEEIRAAVRIRSVDDVLALLERAVVGEMQLENSHSRNRTIASLAAAALRALEVGELEQRLAALEVSVQEKNDWQYGR